MQMDTSGAESERLPLEHFLATASPPGGSDDDEKKVIPPHFSEKRSFA